ncbi:HlyD family secretion protein [Hydrogenophaga sp. RWCD_12]|uniref:HlyD family secretion protein n=1 Tax=Hydrogenophaga sp. RWCD_12 TaxID=3391190 RepID=UPI003984E0A6
MTPPSPPPQRLFRDEALAAQRTQLLGQIVLTPRISMLWLSLVAAALALAVILFLVFGSHTRRVTVTGQLMPAGGLIRVHTPQAGVVLEKRVADGQVVKKGDVLYVLTSDRQGDGARELQADIARQVGARKGSLEQEIERSRKVQDDELANLQRRSDTLRGESAAIAAQIEQQKTRLSIAEDTRKRYQSLADQDYIAREELVQKDIDLTEQRSRLRGLERDALGVQRELGQVQQDIAATKLRNANQLAQLERDVSSTDQQLTEVESRRRVVITAPEAGRATLVVSEVGQTVDVNQALATLVPTTGELQGRLYAPSSSIGFVRPGDQVLLRYQAFPYQKFGQKEGTVETVSTSAVNPGELAGLPATGLPAGEPVFAIQVKLKAGTIAANGELRPLQAGMQLEADILQERRKLYEWMLEPLFSVTRRIEP